MILIVILFLVKEEAHGAAIHPGSPPTVNLPFLGLRILEKPISVSNTGARRSFFDFSEKLGEAT